MIVSTPYLHVQAIRRMYRDQGKPTSCRPGSYSMNLSLLTGGGFAPAGSRRISTTTIDKDSDFVWLSSYFYRGDAVWDPEGSDNGEVSSGNGGGGGVDWDTIDIKLLRTGKSLTTPAAMVPMLFDWVFLGGSGFGDSEGTDTDGSTQSDQGIQRCYLGEPVIIPAGETIQAELVVGRDNATFGALLVLVGVRLSTIGA